jgi:hypothetical protein
MIEKNWIKDLANIENWNKYSQGGEEAYIAYILKELPTANFIVEIGAGDGFHLSNTRYFIENGYDSILIDADNQGNAEVKMHRIIKENVNAILSTYNCPTKFDFLSIDTDGNDFWILDELLTKYSPSLIVAEFNASVQKDKSVSIKYDSNFSWQGDDYYGFSFEAGKKLAEKHGYTIVFLNNNMNIFLLKNEFIEGVDVPEYTYEVSDYFRVSDRTDWVEI